MDSDQNHDDAMSFFIIWVKDEIREWQFSPFFVILIIKTSQFQQCFTLDHWSYMIWVKTGMHDIELKWNVIPWNATNWFQAWIFRECEFTDQFTKDTKILEKAEPADFLTE